MKRCNIHLETKGGRWRPTFTRINVGNKYIKVGATSRSSHEMASAAATRPWAGAMQCGPHLWVWELHVPWEGILGNCVVKGQ